MRLVAFSLLIIMSFGSQASSEDEVGASYRSAKSVPELQKCLTQKLSERGNVTAARIDGGITLLFQEENQEPMVIEVAPSSVKVTTRFVFGTRKLVEACV